MEVLSTDKNNEEIIMLSGYPFYLHGPDPKAVEKVAEKAYSVLESTLGNQLISVSTIGSTAIDGIAGTPVCDILAQLSPWPMSDKAKEKMANAGYEFKVGTESINYFKWDSNVFAPLYNNQILCQITN